MLVWVLLIVLLTPVEGLQPSTFLNKFDTYEECQAERNRIGFDMAEAYPYERTFVIECQERHIKDTKLIPVGLEDDLRAENEYDDTITAFAKKRYPGQDLNAKITNFKVLENESGKLSIVAIQVSIFHKDGGESFILLINKEKVVVAWIDAGEAEELEEEEVFPGKEFA